ncbi:MAG: DUF3365 domain-containing protein [Myxococcota bacterium]|nr:DUF3365 domain-containing protein [Myxococcota bacterium]
MNRIPLTLALAACLLGAGCKAPPPAAPAAKDWSPEAVPGPLQASVQEASTAIGALQASLLQRLTSALQSAGPVGALEVCAAEAQPLTLQVAQQAGVQVGRTSHQLRNPINAPRPWAAAYVKQSAGARFADAKPRVFDLGDRVGMLKPMPVGAMCLTCHGTQVAAEVVAEITARYPQDQARGFSEGDLRGFFWAEVPKRPEGK